MRKYKFYSLVLAISLLLTLCSCGKSEEVKAVESAIESIGAVTIDSGEKIEAVRNSYDMLSDENKAKVENFSMLTEAEAQYAKIAPVHLTVDNINEYLNFNFSYSDVERSSMLGLSFGSTRISFETYSIKDGKYEDVQLSLEVTLGGGWSVSSSDSAHSASKKASEQRTAEREKELEKSGKFDISLYDPSVLACSFSLPVDGKYSETHKLGAVYSYSDPSSDVEYKVIDVTGTFHPG